MKATKSEVKEGFKSFNITFTIESEEEARALYAIFNHVHNCDLFKFDMQPIRKSIGEDYDTPYGKIIANGVRYEEFYK